MGIRCGFRRLALAAFGIGATWAGRLCAVEGWVSWRGPLQAGVSLEVGLPEKWEVGGASHLWSYAVRGGGTPVVADGRAYVFGFYGKSEDVTETLLCLDVGTGKKVWEHRFRDYLSDNVYTRYGIGAPAIDRETGNVYVLSSNGLLMGFTRDGERLWEHSMMEEYGWLTFPNGRTGAPGVDGDLVITHGITANWGTDGPARNRFYAFDKRTGDLVWASTPGESPVDSSFATPVFGDLGSHRVFYAGTGCGNIVCVNARTGQPVWRFRLSNGGVNSGVVLYGKDRLIAVHGKENVDESTSGRLVCLRIPTEYPKGELPLVLGKEAEVWRNGDHCAFSSSPVLVGDRVYTTIDTGSLLCADAETGKTLWQEKLGPDQLHASPTFGDGKLYVPMRDGGLNILRPGPKGAEKLWRTDLGVPCLGAPAICAGKVFLVTDDGMHCFGNRDGEYRGAPGEAVASGGVGEVVSLQVVPPEFALAPGQSRTFTVWGLDAAGRRVKTFEQVEWEPWVPPTAKVKSAADAKFEPGNRLVAVPGAKLSAGAFKAAAGGLSATVRGRVVAGPGYAEDFESYGLDMKNEAGEAVNFPPLPWLGARVKWYVLERDGSKVVANRLDDILFQRTMNFFGRPEMKDYVLEADVMTDGNRRTMSTVGLVNQRYLITLAGNWRILEVSSNHERLKRSVPFKVEPKLWYRLKTHVETRPDGSGVVRAKAYPRTEPEPGAWTIEVPVPEVHRHGAPAVFAFSPQSLMRVYIDNLRLTTGEE